MFRGATFVYGVLKAEFVVATTEIGLKKLPEGAKSALKKAFARVALEKGVGTVDDLSVDTLQRGVLKDLTPEKALKLSSTGKGNFAEIAAAVHLRVKIGSGGRNFNEKKLKKTLEERHGNPGIDIAFEKDSIVYHIEAK